MTFARLKIWSIPRISKTIKFQTYRTPDGMKDLDWISQGEKNSSIHNLNNLFISL